MKIDIANDQESMAQGQFGSLNDCPDYSAERFSPTVAVVQQVEKFHWPGELQFHDCHSFPDHNSWTDPVTDFTVRSSRSEI